MTMTKRHGPWLRGSTTRWLRCLAGVALVAGLVGAATLAPLPATAAPPAEVIAISPNDSDTQILDKAGSVVPTARHRAWQQMELTSFHHFGPNTFTGREWGTGTEDPDVFNPTNLDTDQWMRSLRDTGFKQAILTVKHHDGFLLYPTRYSDHSVRSSSWLNGNGDVVRSFVDSARRYGIKVGFYLSPADLHEAQPGGRFGNNSPAVRTSIPEAGRDGSRPSGPSFAVTANDYNRFYLNTLYELLSDYGQIDEVWWDGADAVGGSREAFNYPDWIRIVRTLQPQAVIFQDGGPDVRWVGNESGVARTSEYSVLPFTGNAAGAADRMTKPASNGATDLGSDSLLTQRNGDGRARWNFVKWLPAECDVSLHSGWFWHPGSGPKSLAELQSIYYSSVGRNCVLLLNVPPDNTGRLATPGVNRLNELARWRSEVFTTDLAENAAAGNDSGTSNTPGNTPAMAVDGDNDTAWQPASNTGSLVLDLGSTKTLNVIGLQENIGVGQRVTSFTVDAWNGTSWTAVTSATTVGYKRLLRLTEPVTAQRLRLRVTSARARPAIATFSAYREGQQANLALGKPARQSTTHHLGADASRAVDGNTDGNFWNNSVTHTSDTTADPAPWWQVDLGATLPIRTVNVYNRTDCCADRLSDYWVFVSNRPFDTAKTPSQQAATPGVWSSHRQAPAGAPTEVAVGSTGRYVMVQQAGPTVLALAEVQVSRG